MAMKLLASDAGASAKANTSYFAGVLGAPIRQAPTCSGSTTSINDLRNPLSSSARRLMRPDAHNPPIFCLEPPIGIAVTYLIRENLRSPKFGVRFRPCRVQWAPVPKTTIYEHSHPRSTKHNICDSAGLSQHLHVNSVAETSRVKLTAQSRLGGCILLPDSPHTTACLRCGWYC